METTEIKEAVKKAYTNVLNERSSGCCGPECCSTGESMSEEYSHIDGYVAEADYGLGCGTPTEFASIKEGDVILDLGSGAGNDVFIASKITGDKGKVIGIDMTEAMISKANENKQKLGISNVEFVLGEIESMPLSTDSVDVVLSNCVLNLVPDKVKSYGEIHRVLKPGGHFAISDIVINGSIPEKLKEAAEMYAGCVAGAVDKEEYIDIIKKTGFKDIQIFKKRNIDLPESVLRKYLSDNEIRSFGKNEFGIESITIGGVKRTD